MDNEATTTTEIEQTSDAFLEGWDGEDGPIVEETTSQLEAETKEKMLETSTEETTGETKTEAVTEEVHTEEPAVSEKVTEQEAPKLWTLHYMGEERQYNEAQLLELAEKGQNMERLQAKQEELRPIVDMLNAFATKAGVTATEYIGFLRAQAKQAEGLSEADAKRAIDLEDREARVAVKEAEEAESRAAAEREAAAKTALEQRRAADLADFQKTFPEAAKDPKAIPPEVWHAVQNGESLVAAYAKHEMNAAKAAIAAAQHEATAAKQNNKNTERSTGSMKTAGEESKIKDPFLDGWDS